MQLLLFAAHCKLCNRTEWPLSSPCQIPRLFPVFLTEAIVIIKAPEVNTMAPFAVILCMSTLQATSSLTFPWPMPNSRTFPGCSDRSPPSAIPHNRVAQNMALDRSLFWEPDKPNSHRSAYSLGWPRTEDEVTSKELVIKVRQSGQCSSTAKHPLHIHACLHGSRARSTGLAWQTTHRPRSDPNWGAPSSDNVDDVPSPSLDTYRFYTDNSKQAG